MFPMDFILKRNGGTDWLVVERYVRLTKTGIRVSSLGQ